jgi:hypothetical protein
MERIGSRAAVAPAEVQRLSRRTILFQQLLSWFGIYFSLMFGTVPASLLLAALLAVGGGSAPSEFSAEIVDLQKTATPTLAKFYFTKDKKRIEMQEASGEETIILNIVPPTAARKGTHIQAGGRGDTIIMNLAAHTSTVLFPQERTYAEGSLKDLMPTELYGLYAFIQPTDVDNACTEWMTRPGAGDETCRNLGRETLNGRDAVKYELSCYGEVCRLWIDRNLHVLLKRETKWNSTELRNIHEGPLPPSLFEVPIGYSSKNIGGILRPSEPQ